MEIGGVTTLLQVFDMQRSVEFYGGVLGFSVVSTSEPGNQFDWAMLTQGNATIMLNTAYEAHERPATPDPARVAAHADTTLYFECNSVEEMYSYLHANMCNTEAPMTTHYGMRQVYLKDPDGYQLCFQHPANLSPELV